MNDRGFQGLPQALWTSISSDRFARCRDCPYYADPSQTHSDCTLRGIRRPGYGAVCSPAQRKAATKAARKCEGCGVDIAHKRRAARYCDTCATERRESHRHSTSPKKEGTMSDTPGHICPHCKKEFGTPHGLDIHIARKHKGATPRKPAVPAPSDAPEISETSAGALQSVTTTDRLVYPDASEPETASQRIVDLCDEIEEIRISLLVVALNAALGEETAQKVISEIVFPAIEAAERAGEARAAL